MKKINLNSVAFLVLGVFLLVTPALSQAIITSLVTAFYRNIDLLVWVNLAQNFWILNLLPKVVGAALVAGFVWKHLKTRFKCDLPKIKVQTTRLATYSLLFMLCAGLFIFADVPVSDAATTALTGYILDTPVAEYAWLIGAYSDGSFYAIDGSTWDNKVTGVGSTAWATYRTNSTALTEQVLAACTSGHILLKDVEFDYDLTIPENVTVTERNNGLDRTFINSANSQGSPYTISVDTVQSGYYLSQDCMGRFIDDFSSTNTNTTITSALTSGAKVEVTKGSYPNTWVSLTNGSSLTIQKGATGITALPSYQLTATLIDYQNGVTKTYTNGHVARTYMNSQSQTIFNNEAQVLPTVIKQEIAGCYQPVDAVYNPDMDTIAIASRFNPTIGALTIINATTLQFISNISFTNADLQPYRIKYDGVNYWITTGSESGSPTFGGPAGLICIDPYTLAWDSYLFPDASGTYANGLALEFADSPTTGKNYVFVGTGSVAEPNWAAKVHKFDPLTFTSGPLTTIDIRNADLGNYAANIRELVNTNDGYIWALGDTYPTQIEIDSMNFKYLYAVAGYEYAYLSGAIGSIPVQFGACYGGDGYLYLGLVNGSIAKVNPTTGAVNFPLTTLSADSLVHHLQALPNGFIFAQLWGSPAIPAYYINTATLTIYDTPQNFTCAHSLTWDAKGYIYVIENANEVYNTQTASLLTRYPIQTPTGANGTLILP